MMPLKVINFNYGVFYVEAHAINELPWEARETFNDVAPIILLTL